MGLPIAHGMRGLERDGVKIAGASVYRDLRGSHEVQHIVRRTRQDRIVLDIAGQDKAGECRTGLGCVGQGRAG
jgi:hypothetical protein